MLRISTSAAEDGAITFRLDGRLTGQWVKLLQATCEARLEQGARIMIDLQNVSFVDREGCAVLRSLADRNVDILNAVPFIAEQIRKAAQ